MLGKRTACFVLVGMTVCFAVDVERLMIDSIAGREARKAGVVFDANWPADPTVSCSTTVSCDRGLHIIPQGSAVLVAEQKPIEMNANVFEAPNFKLPEFKTADFIPTDSEDPDPAEGT